MAVRTAQFMSDVATALRSNGGDITTEVKYSRTENQPPSSGSVQYDSAEAEVEILIPFSFSGRDFTMLQQEKLTITGPFTIYGEAHLRSHANLQLIDVFDMVVEKLEKRIPEALRQQRPTVSARKVKRKTNAILKQLTIPNLSGRK